MQKVRYPNNIKAIRKSKGLLQIHIAKLMGLKSDNRICRLERGLAMPSGTNLLKLANVLQVSIEQLYPESSSPRHVVDKKHDFFDSGSL